MAGFFSGGSSDAVNASVAEAEAAAREAEAARDAIIDNQEIYGENDTNDSTKHYTVPLSGTDTPVATAFLNQQGDWTVPNTGADGATNLNELTDVALVNEANDQFLRYNGSIWTNETVTFDHGITAGTSLEFVGNTLNVSDGGITATQIGSNAVNTGEIVNSAVTSAKIADASITRAKISASGVDGQVLGQTGGALTWVTPAAGEVYTASDGVQLVGSDFSLTDGGVDRTKLDTTNTGTDAQVLSRAGDQFTWVDQSGGGGTDNITASNGLARTGNDIAVVSTGLTATQLATDSVTSDKILAGAVGQDELAPNSVISSKINNGSVMTAALADGAVTGTKIADGAVDETQLADSAVSLPKLLVNGTQAAGSVVGVNPLNDALTWIVPAAGTVYTASDGVELVGSDFQLTDLGVTSGKLAPNAVTSAKIADNNVTADELNVSGDGNSGNILSSDGDGSFSWVARIDELSELVDVHLPSNPTVRSLLEYDVSNSRWQAVAEDEVLTMSQLFDVDFTNIQDNQFIQYNANNPDGARWENVTLNLASMLTAGDGIDITSDVISIPTDGIVTSMIIQNAIGSDEIAADAVTTDEILNGAVTSAKIANNAVTATQIATGTITADQVANNTLTATQLATDSVSSFKLQADSVITAKIADDAVTEPKLAINNTGTDGQVLSRAGTSFAWVNNGSGGGVVYTADESTLTLSAGNQFSAADGGITATQIADTTITGSKIAANTITGSEIATGAIGAGELASDAVTTVKINDSAVTTNKIGDSMITEPKLSTTNTGTDGQVLSLNSGAFTWVSEISVDSNGGLTEDANKRISIGNDAITAARLADNSVTVDAIIDGVITEAKLNITNTGTDGQILSRAGNTFTWIDDAGGVTYTADESTITLSAGNQFSIPASGITSTEIANDAVTASEIATGVVSETKIADLAISTPKLRDQGVTVAKLATNIPVSTFSDVNTSGVNNGQVLGFNGTTWVPVNASGGGNTDNSRLDIGLTPTSLNESDGDTAITVALSIGNMVSGETISGQSVTVTDPTGHTVTVTGSDNTWSFTANGDNVGNYVVRASATFTLTGGTMSVHSSSANLPVIATPANNINWYQLVSDTQPTAITDMTDNGVFSSPETGTWARPSSDTDLSEMAYVAVPTGTYTFRAGLLFATITDLGVISTGYTLYRLDDFAQVSAGGTRIVTITEA